MVPLWCFRRYWLSFLLFMYLAWKAWVYAIRLAYGGVISELMMYIIIIAASMLAVLWWIGWIERNERW